jgi:two-component system, cell cycle sensor histidine kinase and response regulator CckA
MKILHVEDNPGDAKLLRYELAGTAPSFEIEWVDSYNAAVEKLTRCTQDKPCYDLILTDMYLPDGNGLSLLPFIRERGLRLPIVVITGLRDEDSAIEALKAGASDYIIKRDDYLKRLPTTLDLASNKFRIESARRSDPLHVLYCEQNLRDIESTRNYAAVHASHIRLDVVGSYEQVLERFSRMKKETGGALKPCDVILLTYYADTMTAIDLLKELRGVYRTDVPVVITSNEDMMENAAQALRLGADDYIVKSSGYLLQLPFVLENAFNRVQVERERAALKASENHFRLLIENASDLIIVLDKDGVVKYCSPSIKRMLGFQPEDAVGKRYSENIHPEDVPIVESLLSGLLRNPDSSSEPEIVRNRAIDGSWRYSEGIARSAVDASGQVIVIINARDITDRKYAEDSLQESETKYRSLVENSLAGVGIFQDDKCMFVNKKLCEMLGYTYEEMMGVSSVSNLFHPDEKEMMNASIKRIFESGEPMESDFKVIRKDNKILNMKGFFSSIVFYGRRAVAGTIIDTTREKLLENQLRQSHKMEAIGTLAGGIAHDFNNILTVLTGYGTLLKMEAEKGLPIKRNYVDSILSAAGKAANLTQSLLAFARQQPISLRPVSLNGIIIETEKMLRRLLTEDIVMQTILSPVDMIVMADPTQIDQILINLVVNARDAMPNGGSVTLETRMVDMDTASARFYGFDVPGRYAILSVSDTGTGMDENTREHLFEPFFTTKEVGKGTGLGLSTVYGIVKQHNGHITAYSEKNSGTAFNIYLPVINAAEATEQPQVLPSGGTEKILLAEDNDEVREFITTVLNKNGYTVIVSVDGEDAIDRFKANDGISLLILDSVMPKKNGRQVYDEISAVIPDMKVIFTSGYTRDVVLDKGIEDKKYDFIAKPVSPSALLRKVREVLDR